ncbi:MAG: ribosomal protein S18-alanine N-acetyltransferase [Nitrospirota bacterium]
MIKNTDDSSVIEIFIRDMHASDIPEVLRIERMSFTTPWSEAAFFNEIHDPYSITKVAVLEDEVIGYICVNHMINEGHILNLAVHPDLRRRGIATALVEEVLDELRGKGCRSLYLEVRISNLGARRFYERLGFRPVDVRRDYYTFPREDAVIMMLEL